MKCLISLWGLFLLAGCTGSSTVNNGRPQESTEGVPGYVIDSSRIRIRRVPEGIRIFAERGTIQPASGISVDKLYLAVYRAPRSFLEQVRKSFSVVTPIPNEVPYIGAVSVDRDGGMDQLVAGSAIVPDAGERLVYGLSLQPRPRQIYQSAEGTAEASTVTSEIPSDEVVAQPLVREPISVTFVTRTSATLEALAGEGDGTLKVELRTASGSSTQDLKVGEKRLLTGLSPETVFTLHTKFSTDPAGEFRTLGDIEENFGASALRMFYQVGRVFKRNPITGRLIITGSSDKQYYGEYDGRRWRHTAAVTGIGRVDAMGSPGALFVDNANRVWLKINRNTGDAAAGVEIWVCEGNCLAQASWKKAVGPLAAINFGTPNYLDGNHSTLAVSGNYIQVVYAESWSSGGSGKLRIVECGPNLAACARGEDWQTGENLLGANTPRLRVLDNGWVQLEDLTSAIVNNPWLRICKTPPCRQASSWIQGKLPTQWGTARLQLRDHTLYAANNSWTANFDLPTYALRISQCDTRLHDCLEKDSNGKFFRFVDDTPVTFTETFGPFDSGPPPFLSLNNEWVWVYMNLASAHHNVPGTNRTHIRRCPADQNFRQAANWSAAQRLDETAPLGAEIVGADDITELEDGSIWITIRTSSIIKRVR